MKKSALSLLVSLLLCSGLAWGQSKIALENQVKGSLTIATGKTLTLVDMTLGSCLFAGTGGLVSQDNANCFWDNTAKRFQVGPRTGFLAAVQTTFDDVVNTSGLLNGFSASKHYGFGSIVEDNTTNNGYALLGYLENRSASARGVIEGVAGWTEHNGAGALTTMNGVDGFAHIRSGAGNVTNMSAVEGAAAVALGFANTVTHMAAFRAETNARSGGTVTNNYGLKVDDQDGVGTNNWAIKTGTGAVEFDVLTTAGFVTTTAGGMLGSTATDLTNLQHDHGDADDGGALVVAALPPFATEIVMIAAGCDNTTAAKGLDIPTANGPTATCFGAAPDRFAYLDFADGASALTASGHFRLPAGWTGNIDLDLYWACSAATCSTNNVSWNIQTVCIGDGEDYLNPTYNALQEIVDAGLATLHLRNRATQTAVTTTGCAAGETFFFQLNRDPTDASDTFAGTAGLLEIVWTLRRTPQS